MARFDWTPYYEDINLRTGYDWIPNPISSDTILQPGTAAVVKWANGTIWEGEVSGNTITFRVEAEQADPIPNGTLYEMKVSYPNGTTLTTDDYALYVGKARRNAITVRN
ncbi:hypothetical protein B2J88_08120 [Rhodococcus sp. SRB_17]|nr:hypothetical protein [Rhodococcus sp. SRB_17]